jgi:hypothetical protein
MHKRLVHGALSNSNTQGTPGTCMCVLHMKLHMKHRLNSMVKQLVVAHWQLQC